MLRFQLIDNIHSAYFLKKSLLEFFLAFEALQIEGLFSGIGAGFGVVFGVVSFVEVVLEDDSNQAYFLAIHLIINSINHSAPHNIHIFMLESFPSQQTQLLIAVAD